MKTQSQREQLSDEYRAHRQKIERLQSEFATSREINGEYKAHLGRVAEIMGDDQPIVGGRSGRTA